MKNWVWQLPLLFPNLPAMDALIMRLKAALGFAPTGSQERLFPHLAAFLTAEQERPVFLLQGFAGTGKTTVLAALVKTLPSLGMSAILMAPTGRAAKVMSGYSQRSAFTIHRLIFDWSSEDYAGVRRKNNNRQRTLFIVDEASMIGEQAHIGDGLLRELVEYVFQEPDSGNRLMLVGDPAQLPPVGETLSPALRISLLRRMNLQASGFQLRDVVRQAADSGILANATRVRQTISQGKFALAIRLGFADVQRIAGLELEDALRTCYDTYGEDGTVVICRANRQAVQYNQYIRRQIFFREEELEAGDRVMVVKNDYHWLSKGESAGFIANGDFAEVLRINQLEEAHDHRFAQLTLRLLDQEHQEAFTAMAHLQPLYDPAPALPQADLVQIRRAVEADWAGADSETERRDGMAADPYLHALQLKFAYALTCHKSQGGQWPAVFIDLGYLREEMMDTELLRWLYTAMTRATEKLFLINFPDEFVDLPTDSIKS